MTSWPSPGSVASAADASGDRTAAPVSPATSASPPRAAATARPPRPPRSPVPAAAWVAAVGAALVLTAASVLVVNNWNHLAPAIKLAGLVMACGLVAAAAEGARRSFPVVARALAHLAAALAVPATIAAMATAQYRWPGAIAAGGAVGVVACLTQSRRWRLPWLVPAAEVAGALSLAGVATLAHAPLGVVLAGAAVALAVAGRDRSAARLAIVSASVPLLAALGAAGVGPGTAVRLGASGATLVWAAPVAGIVAAAVLALAARRLRELALLAPSALSALLGAVIGMAQGHAPYVMWAALPAVMVLALLGAGAWLGREAANTGDPLVRRFGTATVSAAHVVIVGFGSLALALPVIAFRAMHDLAAAGTLVVWCVALAWAGLPLRGGRSGALPAGAPLPPPGSAAAPWWSAIASTERAAGALALVAAAGAATGSSTAALVTGLVEIVVLAAASLPAVAGTRRPLPVLHVERAALLAGVAVAATHYGPATYLALAVVTALVGVGTVPAASARRAGGRALAIASAGWFLAATAWTLGATPWSWALGFTIAAALLAAGRLLDPAAALLAPAALAALLALPVSPTVRCLAMLLAALAAGGMAMVADRWNPASTLAAALATHGVGYAAVADRQAYVSLGLVLLGVQLALYAAARHDRERQVTGGLLALGGLTSLPWTTGFVPWLVHGLAPHGVTGTDLAVAAIAAGLLAGGVLLRRSERGSSSWVAYGPGLALAGVYLLATQPAAHQNGRVGVALAVGLVAVAIGGLRRLGAPLLLGTALVLSTVLMASGHQLARLGVWTWLAIGGAVLIAIALLIEKRSSAAPESVGDDDAPAGERLVQVVWRRFG